MWTISWEKQDEEILILLFYFYNQKLKWRQYKFLSNMICSTVRVTAYAFRHDAVFCHLYTHNFPFPLIRHALYSRKSAHIWCNKDKKREGQCPVKRSHRWSITVNYRYTYIQLKNGRFERILFITKKWITVNLFVNIWVNIDKNSIQIWSSCWRFIISFKNLLFYIYRLFSSLTNRLCLYRVLHSKRKHMYISSSEIMQKWYLHTHRTLDSAYR